MENQQADIPFGTLANIAVSTSLLKVFSVLYFLFLPVLYALDIINVSSLGYIGALLILGILSGALLLAYKPYYFARAKLLAVSGFLLLCGTLFLFLKERLFLLALAYLLIGFAIGIGITIINELAARLTSKNNRYGIFANISMVWDILRIVYTLVVGALYVTVGFTGLVWFALANVLVLLYLFYRFSIQYNLNEGVAKAEHISNPVAFLKQHKAFAFVTGIEFLDSFASSQLFIFLPVLLLAKEFSIPNVLIFQSIVFGGYLSGRKIVSLLAKKLNGFTAIVIAESGMVITIVLLVCVPASAILYLLCFLLGIFTRGTSPVIKAMAFDQLETDHMRQGSAIHVVSGDSGSAIGQLIFGLLLTGFGVTAPFVASAICASMVVVACVCYEAGRVRKL